jgi:outer membrane protein assembly factor BamE (lipoprotein component of BamABCDE complex)
MRTAIVALVAAGVLTSACSRIQNNIGYVADESLINEIKAGVDNRDSVAKTLGRPSIAAQWTDKQWFYVSRNTVQTAFFVPQPKSQSILVITFDAKDNVSAVERRGLEKVANIDPENDKTPTLGRETGILADLFGNIGTVGAAAPGDGPQ